MNIDPGERHAFAILFTGPVGIRFRQLFRANPPRANITARREQELSRAEVGLVAEGWHMLLDQIDQLCEAPPPAEPRPQFVHLEEPPKTSPANAS